MAIVWPCPLPVDAYVAAGREVEVPRPVCPSCAGPLVFWSGYWRHVRAAGRCLGYSADTAFDPALLSWLSEADLIVHETNLGPIHTPYEKLASLPSDLRGKMNDG